MVLSTVDQSTDLVNSLSDFAQSPTSDVPPDLEAYLTNLARQGATNAPWHLVKPLIRVKLESAIDSFLGDASTASIDDYYPRPNMESFQLSAYRHSVLSTLDQFTNAPFTIQRLCELALSPSKHYRRVDKYLRGLLKCLTVVSCIDPNGQKIVFDQDEEEMALANSADSDPGAVASSAGAVAAASGIADSANASDQAGGDSLSGDDELEASGSGSGSEKSAPVGLEAPTLAEVDEDDEIESDSSSGCGAPASDAPISQATVAEAVVATDSDVVVFNPDVVVSNPDVVVSNSNAFFTEVVASTCETASRDEVVLQTDEDKEHNIDETEEVEAEAPASCDNVFDSDPPAEGAIEDTVASNESDSAAD